MLWPGKSKPRCPLTGSVGGWGLNNSVSIALGKKDLSMWVVGLVCIFNPFS